jgi:glycosyltransferase involved in cell wall biosynthesis
VLAWDNGSTDGSVETLRRWIPTRLPGEVFTGKPLSVGGALRELVARAPTRWCARMDADDRCHPERFARQVELLQRHSDIAALGTQIQWIDEAGDSLAGAEPVPTQHEEIVYALLRRTPLIHPTVLFDRTAVLAAGNYQADCPVEDYELFLRLARRGYRLANLPEILLEYRIHPQSAAQSLLRAGRLHDQMNRDLAIHGPEIFGLSAREIQQLKAKRHPCALLAMRKMIRHIKAASHRRQRQYWRNPELIQSMRYMTASPDWLTRAALLLLDTKHRSPLRALPLLLRKIFRNLKALRP